MSTSAVVVTTVLQMSSKEAVAVVNSRTQEAGNCLEETAMVDPEFLSFFPQSRQSTRLSFQLSELGSHPLTL